MAEEIELTPEEAKIYNPLRGIHDGTSDAFALVRLLENIEGGTLAVGEEIYDSANKLNRFCTAYIVFLIEHYISDMRHSGSVVAGLALTDEYHPLSKMKRMERYKEKFEAKKLWFGKTYEDGDSAYRTKVASLNTLLDSKYRMLAKNISADFEKRGKLGYLDEVQSQCDRLLGLIDYDGNNDSAFESERALRDIIKNSDFTYTVKLNARYDGERTFADVLRNARIGDVIECQLIFTNDRGTLTSGLAELGSKMGLSITSSDIMIRFVLPNNMEYIENTTVLYNSSYPQGVLLDGNTVATTGINIGNYYINASAVVRIKCRIVNNSLATGINQLVTWASGTVAGKVEKDDFSIFLKY